MIAKSFRASALISILAIVFPLSGCLQYRDEIVLLPDGSGKLIIHAAFNLEILEKLEEMGMDLGDVEKEMEFDSDDVDNLEGIVALSKPKSEKKGTWQSWSVTAYFEDINKVKIFEKDEDTEEKKLQLAFAFRKEGEGHVLEIDDRLMDDEEMDEDMDDEEFEAGLEMLKDYTKGFEISRSVKMPGPVTAVDGFAKKEGRTAVNRLDEASLKKKDEMVKAFKSIKRKVVCGKSEISDADVAAFKKELGEAKDAWSKIKAEMKAEAERKKKMKSE